MSVLNYFKPQKTNKPNREMYGRHQDLFDDKTDEESVEVYWDKIVKDIHKDPEWFKFADE